MLNILKQLGDADGKQAQLLLVRDNIENFQSVSINDKKRKEEKKANAGTFVASLS